MTGGPTSLLSALGMASTNYKVHAPAAADSSGKGGDNKETAGTIIGRALLHRGSLAFEELEEEKLQPRFRSHHAHHHHTGGAPAENGRCCSSTPTCLPQQQTVLPGRQRSPTAGHHLEHARPHEKKKKDACWSNLVAETSLAKEEEGKYTSSKNTYNIGVRAQKKSTFHRAHHAHCGHHIAISAATTGREDAAAAAVSKIESPSCSSALPSAMAAGGTAGMGMCGCLYPARRACTVALDLGSSPTTMATATGNSSCCDEQTAFCCETVRHHQKLRWEARSLLIEAYGNGGGDGGDPEHAVVELRRDDASNFIVLPTVAGLAVVIFKPAKGHRSREYTALWFGARMIARASASAAADSSSSTRLRGGLASGMFETVQDVYGTPSAIGPSLGAAVRIMECALPGQILACAATAVPELDLENDIRAEAKDPIHKTYAMSFVVDEERHEVIIANDESSTATVQAVVGDIILATTTNTTTTGAHHHHSGGAANGTTELQQTPEETTRLHFGRLDEPVNKWYLRLKPTEYDDNRGGIKAKVPPTELLRRHKRVAFVGVTNSGIVDVFRQVVSSDPTKTWDRMYFLFLSDDRLRWIASNNTNNDGDQQQPTVEDLIRAKNDALLRLNQILTGRVRDLHFLEYDRPFYCASYWDWDERGGSIHVSPLVWGADPKTCPAMNYRWIGTDPGDDYVAYQDGLTSLLRTSTRMRHPHFGGKDLCCGGEEEGEGAPASAVEQTRSKQSLV